MSGRDRHRQSWAKDERRNRQGMTGWGFWAMAAGLALAVALVLVQAMRRAPKAGTRIAELR